ncbi:MAG TPA: tetratricopeptide repeat protein [Longimicrobiaceae bacterium]|nr:tetratricopeptide repeat protein [Longimicrobiaceae bacterium]
MDRLRRSCGRHLLLAIAWTLIVLAVGRPAAAQTPAPSPAMAAALELFQARQWPEARRAFEAIVEREPENVPAWVRLGLTYDALGEHERAVRAFEKANAVQLQAPVLFRISASYAKLGDRERAWEALDAAMKNGFVNQAMYQAEPAFRPFHEDPRFRGVAERMQMVARPCPNRPDYHLLDFWIGDWEQQTLIGQVVGETSIRAANDGCVLIEATTNPAPGMPPYTASALHYFDPADSRWKQTYVDSRGNPSFWIGEMKDGEFVYREVAGEGSESVSRSTLKQNGSDRVRWRFETSADGGRTWRTVFDGFFVRKPAAD